MARRIEILSDVELRDANNDDAVIVDNRGKAVVWTHERFLRTLVADPKFIEGLEGIDATELQYDTRKAVCTEAAKSRGFLVLNESVYQRLLGTVRQPKNPFLPGLAVCFYEYMRSVRDAKECDDDGNVPA